VLQGQLILTIFYALYTLANHTLPLDTNVTYINILPHPQMWGILILLLKVVSAIKAGEYTFLTSTKQDYPLLDWCAIFFNEE
jgi:hypothetical protein